MFCIPPDGPRFSPHEPLGIAGRVSDRESRVHIPRVCNVSKIFLTFVCNQQQCYRAAGSLQRASIGAATGMSLNTTCGARSWRQGKSPRRDITEDYPCGINLARSAHFRRLATRSDTARYPVLPGSTCSFRRRNFEAGTSSTFHS